MDNKRLPTTISETDEEQLRTYNVYIPIVRHERISRKKIKELINSLINTYEEINGITQIFEDRTVKYVIKYWSKASWSCVVSLLNLFLVNLRKPEIFKLPFRGDYEKIRKVERFMNSQPREYSFASRENRNGAPYVSARPPNCDSTPFNEIKDYVESLEETIVPVEFDYLPWIAGPRKRNFVEIKKFFDGRIQRIVCVEKGIALHGKQWARQLARKWIEGIYDLYRKFRIKRLSIVLTKNFQILLNYNNYYLWNRIFEETGVIVDSPTFADASFTCELIYLENRDPSNALRLISVYSNENCVKKIAVEEEKMDNVENILTLPKAETYAQKISICRGNGFIELRGSRADVTAACVDIEDCLRSLKSNFGIRSIENVEKDEALLLLDGNIETTKTYRTNVLVNYMAETKEIRFRGPRNDVNPLTKEMEVKLEKHRTLYVQRLSMSRENQAFLVGQNGCVIKYLRQRFCVRIEVPRAHESSDRPVIVAGDKKQVDLCLQEIRLNIPELDEPTETQNPIKGESEETEKC